MPTTPPNDRRDLEDFNTAAGNFRSICRTMGNRTREHFKQIAGALYVLEEIVYREAQEVWLLWAAQLPQELPPEDEQRQRPAKRKAAAGAARAPKGQGSHRHTFGPDGICSSCGDKRLRAPKGSATTPAERPSAEARTVPLPLPTSRRPIGDSADDPFEGGTFGSSGTGDR